MKKAIISVLGRDRPGIIALAAKILFQHDCNIENFSQTILQSQFAGIIIVSLAADLSLMTLGKKLNEGLTPLGLHVHVNLLAPEDRTVPKAKTQPFIISTVGPDRKGLVAGITEVIARHEVNITNLQAVFKGGDDPGDNVMIYEVDVPLGVDHTALDRDLREQAKAFALDITIQHRDVFEALNRI
jgi:glycine cleavage system transcriptional repressor